MSAIFVESYPAPVDKMVPNCSRDRLRNLRLAISIHNNNTTFAMAVEPTRIVSGWTALAIMDHIL